MSHVIKRLRNKIWFILAASFYTLIFTILTILYLLSDQRAYEATYQSLYSSLLSDELYFANVFFSIEADANYTIINTYSDFDMGADSYEMLLHLVLENARDHNILEVDGETWAYAFVPVGDLFHDIGEGHQRIIFVNVSDIITRHADFLRMLIVIGVSSFLVVVSGSFIVAKYFVKSTKRSFEIQETMTAEQKKFTANATHELRTPIAMIKGSYDEILRNKTQTIESQLKWFKMIEFGTRQMENLTNELLTLARLEGEKIELLQTEVNVSEALSRTIDVMQVLANEKGIQIIENIEPDLILQLNEEKFVQISMIFLENAIKYVNDQGRIETLAYKRDGHVIVSIQNSGPGIPPEALPRLFDRFYRVNKKGKGTGLGLPIAKEIMEQLGGEIAIDSVVNEVTTVLLKF